MNKVNEKIVLFRKQYSKWSFWPTLKRKIQFSNGAITIKILKCRINLHKPFYTGISAADLRKGPMQGFQYNDIKNKYWDQSEMLLMDTDSLMYKIEAENTYECLQRSKNF